MNTTFSSDPPIIRGPQILICGALVRKKRSLLLADPGCKPHAFCQKRFRPPLGNAQVSPHPFVGFRQRMGKHLGILCPKKNVLGNCKRHSQGDPKLPHEMLGLSETRMNWFLSERVCFRNPGEFKPTLENYPGSQILPLVLKSRP